MRAVPFNLRNAIIPIVAAALAPMLPLALTVFAFDEIIMKILGILL
jgi:hypothetical protein